MCTFALCRAFFFNDTATTEIYTLSLHDALPIYVATRGNHPQHPYWPDTGDDGLHLQSDGGAQRRLRFVRDRKSTRLNSSHANISYAVFCLKKQILIVRLILVVSISSQHHLLSFL